MKPLPLAQVPSALLDRVLADAPRFFAAYQPVSVNAASIIHNPYSIVVRLSLAGDAAVAPLYAKMALTQAHATPALAAMLRAEHAILQTLHAAEQRSPQAGSGAVVPFACYDDIPALVTVEAPGATLRRRYAVAARRMTGSLAHARLLSRVEACGGWLRRFHDLTAAGERVFDVAELKTYCQVRLDKLEATQPGFLSQRALADLLNGADRVAGTLARSPVHVAGRHNDFASHNIIATPGSGIRVLDFTMFDIGERAFDVCNFWFELEMLQYDPSYSGVLLRQMQTAFLASYGGMQPDAPEFMLARLRYSINRLLNLLATRSALRYVSPHWQRSVREIRAWLLAFGGAASVAGT